MNDISFYLGRQRGEGSLIEKTHFVNAFFVFNQEQYAFRFANVQNSSAWGRNYKIRPLARSFNGDPTPSIYDDIIHVINDTRPSPSVFAYCKQSKTGRWAGLGTRLHVSKKHQRSRGGTNK